jgi:hypothetical protein
MIDTYFIEGAMTENMRKQEEAWEDKVPREFLARVCRRLRDWADAGRLVEARTNFDSCDYHGHTTGRQRRMCKKERQDLIYLKEHLLLTLGDQ